VEDLWLLQWKVHRRDQTTVVFGHQCMPSAHD
jgi:hypothetical protein